MKVAIAEGLSPQKALLEGLKLLNPEGLEFSHDHTVLIIIDFPLPTSTPGSVNPDTLGALITYLKNQNVNRIFIVPATLDGVNSDVALKIHGLDKFIQMKGGELINQKRLFFPQKAETDHGETSYYPPLIYQIDDYVILSQLRTDPTWQLHTAISTLQYFLPREKRLDPSILPPNQENDLSVSSFTQNSGGLHVSSEIEFLYTILSWKKPALVVNDGFLLLDGNGPYLWRNPNIQTPHHIILSADLFAAEWTTLQHFGIAPTQSPVFVKEILQEPTIARIEIITSTPFTSPPPLHFPEQDLSKIRIPGLSLFVGDLSNLCRSTLTQLLYHLDLLFFKDGTNLGSWALIAGRNPPQPPVDKDFRYIIFGDMAIEDTQNYNFRVIPKYFYKKPLNLMGFEIGGEKTLSGDDLARLIFSKQRKIRTKQQKLRNKFSDLQTILKEKIDIHSARLVELQKHKALDLKIAKMETKIQQIRINTEAKHEKQAVQEQKIENVLNRNILEISGELRSFWDALPYFPILWESFQIPTLLLYIRNTKEWYQYPKIDSKALKKSWQTHNRDLKTNLTQLNAPLLDQINEDLARIQLNRKKKLKALSMESKTIKSEIEANFNPFIKYLKKELRSTRIEKFKSFFQFISNFQSLPKQSNDEYQGENDDA